MIPAPLIVVQAEPPAFAHSMPCGSPLRSSGRIPRRSAAGRRTGGEGRDGADHGPVHRIVGTAVLKQWVPNSSDMTGRIALLDVSLADAPALLVAEAHLHFPSGASCAQFELVIPVGAVSDRRSYALEARAGPPGKESCLRTVVSFGWSPGDERPQRVELQWVE